MRLFTNRWRAIVPVAAALVWPGAARSLEGEPAFTGFWTEKDPAGTGGFLYDMTWNQLVSNWKELGAKGQYLVDVEIYRKDGAWRFAAVWRVGPGNGGLLLASWQDFVKTWQDLKATQDLIDIEVIDDGGQHKFLGVWQRKQDGDLGEALYASMSWDELVAKHAELGKSRYLASIAPYFEGNKLVFAAVWRPGHGNGGLYRYSDWPAFLARKRVLDKTQGMLDFKAIHADDGGWTFIHSQHG